MKFEAKGKECEQEPDTHSKRTCISEFLSLLSDSNLLAGNDLGTTCGCLEAAMPSMPTCGIFGKVSELQTIIPVGVCTDLSGVCEDLSDFSSTCLQSSTKSYSTLTSCRYVEYRGDECKDDADYIWGMGTDALSYCQLEDESVASLELFYDSCPHTFDIEETTSKTTTTTESGSSAVGWFFGLFGMAIVGMALFLGFKYYQRGEVPSMSILGLTRPRYMSVPMAPDEDGSTGESQPFHL